MTILLRHSIGLDNNARDVSRAWLKKKGLYKKYPCFAVDPFRLSKDILGLVWMLTNMKGPGSSRGKVSNKNDLYVSNEGK